MFEMFKDKWILEALKGSSLGTKLSAIKKFIVDKSKIDNLTKCALCPNMCRFACPVSVVHARETTSPSGKSRIALFLKKNYIEKNETNIRPLYYCLACDSCSVSCPYNFSVNELIRPLRENYYKLAIYPQELRELITMLKEFKCIYNLSNKKPDIKNEENINIHEALLYPGCIMMKYYPNNTNVLSKLLEIMDLSVKVFSEMIDCGFLAYELGAHELFLEIASELANKINSYNAKYLITVCPECTFTFRDVYHDFKIKLRPKIYHIAEFINERMEGFALKQNLKVTIHDSSTLAIKLKKPNLLNDILKRIEGLEVILPVRYGLNTFEIVGENSFLYWVDRDLAYEINKERGEELSKFANNIIVASFAAKKSFEDLGYGVKEISEFIWDLINGLGESK